MEYSSRVIFIYLREVLWNFSWENVTDSVLLGELESLTNRDEMENIAANNAMRWL